MEYTNFSFKALQNGSDIRGVAMEGFGKPVNLTDKAVYCIGVSFVRYISSKTSLPSGQVTIALGHDSRLTGPKLTHILSKAISDAGAKVKIVGLASTPAMFKATNSHYGLGQASIMVTASHLPMERNGMKFFLHENGLDKENITEILNFAQKLYDNNVETAISVNVAQALEDFNGFDSVTETQDLKPCPSVEATSFFMETYAKLLRRDIFKAYYGFYGKTLKEAGFSHGHSYLEPKILQGIKIAVDAGNGAGGFFASHVLAPLGADVSGSQFLEPDGNFPNHIPNPEDATAISSISEAVLTTNSDLGIIFDTDVDRASAIGASGKEINRNKMIALIASLMKLNSCYNTENATIVTDSVTSDQLSAFLERDLGFTHLRYKRGYKNVINKANEINTNGGNAPLAMETSGHGALQENSMLDDGAYLAALIIAGQAFLLKEKNQSVEDLIDAMGEPLESAEFRLAIDDENFKEIGQAAINHLRAQAEEGLIVGASIVEPNYEGVRIAFDCPQAKGWALLRLSLHDPLLPLNIEASNQGGVQYMKEQIAKQLSTFPIKF